MWKPKTSHSSPLTSVGQSRMPMVRASYAPSRVATPPPAPQRQTMEPRWSDTILILLDTRYRTTRPAFISKQIESLKLLAPSVNHNLTIIVDYLDIQNKISSLSGEEADKAADAFKLLAIEKAKEKRAHHVAYILEPNSYARMNDMNIDGYGYTTEHKATHINLILTCNNSRALAHEYLHAIGYNTSRFHNTQPFNGIHNDKFDAMMDNAGCSKSTFPKDY